MPSKGKQSLSTKKGEQCLLTKNGLYCKKKKPANKKKLGKYPPCGRIQTGPYGTTCESGEPKKHAKKQEVGEEYELGVPIGYEEIIGHEEDNEPFEKIKGRKGEYVLYQPFKANFQPLKYFQHKGKTYKKKGGRGSSHRRMAIARHNPWLQHVAQIRRQYPGYPQSEIMKMASDTY